jgi:hypothetical protein
MSAPENARMARGATTRRSPVNKAVIAPLAEPHKRIGGWRQDIHGKLFIDKFVQLLRRPANTHAKFGGVQVSKRKPLPAHWRYIERLRGVRRDEYSVWQNRRPVRS